MPGIVNRPSARVTEAYVEPEGPWTATTRTPSRGPPVESRTDPAIAPVVTPCANAAGMANNETAAAAKPARPTLTIQRMDGPLLRGNECRVLVTIETGRKSPGLAGASRTLGRRFTQQIHGRDTDEKIRCPRREHWRQHTARADRLSQLKHQQHDKGGRQSGGDAAGGA